jgi:anaphase-promoting complex subunit 1
VNVKGTVTVTVGVLLGMAASKLSSCDLSISKMLCLHVPSLIPQHFSAIDVASSVQTAAVIGTGLLFLGSSHRMMTEFLLNEIGKRPESDVSTFDRESYTLSCGIALGMVNVGVGSDSNRVAGIADLHVSERLHRYIIGGIDSDESRRSQEMSDRFSLPSANQTGENEKCSIVFEGRAINTDVTAPGASLALGLMFLKSGSRSIAAVLALPDSHFLLEFVRPDFLGLRVIARALVLWDEIQGSHDWIDLQIPLVVRRAREQMKEIATAATLGRPLGGTRVQIDFDRRAVRQIYVHVVSAACFSLALRYAGTANASVSQVLLERFDELHHLRYSNDAVSVACRPELAILDSCIGTVLISISIVLAGTGDLSAFRRIRLARWRCDEVATFGSHMVCGMATGLLFLGGGTATLGREPKHIAALLTAFYPRYPTTSWDNQHHLQALRHLYVLATKTRELIAIDVDTKEMALVSINLITSSGRVTEKRLPCLLNDTDDEYAFVLVKSEKYYETRLDFRTLEPHYRFYVKRRPTLSPRQRMLRQLESTSSDVRHTTIYATHESHESLSIRLFIQSLLSDNTSHWNRRLVATSFQKIYEFLKGNDCDNETQVSTDLLYHWKERLRRRIVTSEMCNNQTI